MGVARYKSTGDMLGASELSSVYTKQVDSEEEDAREESSRARPLLHRQRPEEHDWRLVAKWRSCKLLGGERNNTDNENECQRKGQQADQLVSELKPPPSPKRKQEAPQSKSMGDFLNFNCYGHQVGEIGRRQVGGNKWGASGGGGGGVEHYYEQQVKASAEVWLDGEREEAAKLVSEDQVEQVEPRCRANGARSERRVTMSRTASLSLSSPALSREQAGELAALRARRMTEVEQSFQPPIPGHRQPPPPPPQQQQMVSRPDGSHQQQQWQQPYAGRDNGARPSADLNACETKAASLRADDKRPSGDHFVDVAKLQQRQQRCQQNLERKPELTNERPSCNNAANKDANIPNPVHSLQPEGSSKVANADGCGFAERVAAEWHKQSHGWRQTSPSFAGHCSVSLMPPFSAPIQSQEPFGRQSAHSQQTGLPANGPSVANNNTPSQPNSGSGQQTKLACTCCSPATANNLMVDFNATTNTSASEPMGPCCNSWRQALNPTSSGSYKVAQKQQLIDIPISGMSGGQFVGQEISGRPASEPFRIKAGRKVSRFSRPGRSPISLQRQTNARLTKHKIKIQQQRQEQLAYLAIGGQEQLNQLDQNCGSSHTNDQQTLDLRGEIVERRQELESNVRTRAHESLYSINGLIDRLSLSDTLQPTRLNLPNNTPNNVFINQREQVDDNLASQTDNRLAYENLRHQHWATVSAQAPTGAIEICDSQLASSSSRSQPRVASSNSQRISTGGEFEEVLSVRFGQMNLDANRIRYQPNAGNVIVYKSINMLRNESSDLDYNCGNNGGKGRQGARNLDEMIESDAQTISSSTSTLSLNKPFCKICHLGTTKNGDKLISPCRCSGTMQYIHCGCLLKWLEISNRTNEKPMSCELCAHEYTWHKKFNYSQLRLPQCTFGDVILHIIFLLAIGVMLFSALAPMIYKNPHEPTAPGSSASQTTTSYKVTPNNDPNHLVPSSSYHHQSTFGGQPSQSATGRLAHDEKFMLLCAASFFVSFFLAIYVQTKARDTLYGLVVKFLGMNQTYYITEYDHGQLNGYNNNSINSVSNNKQQQVCEDSRAVGRKSSQKS